MLRTVLTLWAAVAMLAPARGGDWLQFRGGDGSSQAADGSLPSALEPALVAWKAPLPARGVSGPIVVDSRVIVTAAGGYHQDRLYLVAFDTQTGRPRWQREFWATGRTLCHPTSSVAAPTPASDGERIFAFYSSNDLACTDLDGNLLWFRGLGHDYPAAGNDVGMASSPLAIDGVVIVQVECQGDSFACGLDAATGLTLWRMDRKKEANWCSPAAARDAQGRALALLQSGDALTAVDPKTGAVRWRYAAGCSTIPSPVAVGDRVLVAAGGVTALAPGDGQDPAVVWQSGKLAPGGASPVPVGERLLVINRAGVMQSAALADGQEQWKLRLKGNHWATPIVAGQHVYCVNQDGVLQVVRLDDRQPEIVSELELGEEVLGSPAAADGALFLRGDRQLWKIAGTKVAGR